MSRFSRAMALSSAAALVVVACTKVPYTDRKQVTLMPKATMHEIGRTTYDEMLASVKVVKKGENKTSSTRWAGASRGWRISLTSTGPTPSSTTRR